MQSNIQVTSKPTAFYRLPKVREICGGVAPSTIWTWVKQGKFPKPIKLAENTTAWIAAEVEAWVQSRITASKQQGGAK